MTRYMFQQIKYLHGYIYTIIRLYLGGVLFVCFCNDKQRMNFQLVLTQLTNPQKRRKIKAASS